LPVAVIALMALDHFVLTRFYRPGQHAERTKCIGPVDGAPKWQNTCDEPLNFTYCLISEGGVKEVCREHTLAPGEGVTDIDDAMAELGGLAGASSTCGAWPALAASTSRASRTPTMAGFATCADSVQPSGHVVRDLC
jgi:hypothetical protein